MGGLPTFAIFIYACFILGIVPLSILTLYYCIFHSNYLWSFALIYIGWYFYDLDVCNTGGRRLEWFRNAPLWKYSANFFPVTLVKTAELDPNKGNYLLGSHPHGIICAGATLSFGTDGAGWSEKFKNLIPNFLMLNIFHRAPGLKELYSSLGMSVVTHRNI